MVKTMPNWARRGLKDDGALRVERAVAAAERLTRAELVPVLARRSAAMRHAPVMAALILLLALQVGGWSLGRTVLPWGHGAWLVLDALAAGLLGWGLGRRPWLQRWLTPEADRREAVERAALNAFHAFGLDGTAGRHGVLLYVSLAEHQAVVLADKAVAAKVPAATWNRTCDLLLAGAAQGDLAGGYERALAECTAILKKPFPAKRKNPNELKDRLRILDHPF